MKFGISALCDSVLPSRSLFLPLTAHATIKKTRRKNKFDKYFFTAVPPGRLVNVLCRFNLRPVSKGLCTLKHKRYIIHIFFFREWISNMYLGSCEISVMERFIKTIHR